MYSVFLKGHKTCVHKQESLMSVKVLFRPTILLSLSTECSGGQPQVIFGQRHDQNPPETGGCYSLHSSPLVVFPNIRGVKDFQQFSVKSIHFRGVCEYLEVFGRLQRCLTSYIYSFLNLKRIKYRPSCCVKADIALYISYLLLVPSRVPRLA